MGVHSWFFKRIVPAQFLAAALAARVAAGFPPAVKPGIRPGGLGAGHGSGVEFAAGSRRLEAARRGNQDGCRYRPGATATPDDTRVFGGCKK
jgi:hypothetical protein